MIHHNENSKWHCRLATTSVMQKWCERGPKQLYSYMRKIAVKKSSMVLDHAIATDIDIQQINLQFTDEWNRQYMQRYIEKGNTYKWHYITCLIQLDIFEWIKWTFWHLKETYKKQMKKLIIKDLIDNIIPSFEKIKSVLINIKILLRIKDSEIIYQTKS